MKAVLDTNVLVYDTFRDSVYHEQAKSILNRLEEWVLPLIVIYEYIWFMVGLRVKVEDIVDKVKEYVLHSKSKLISEGTGELNRALNLLLTEKISPSRFNDKIILSVAVKYGCLATFDKKLRKQAREMEVITLPQKLI